jgi:prolipoprotein diacylglyceryltransferase
MFAYEAILNLIGMLLLLWIARKFAARLFDGDIALLYIVWYGAVRSVLELYRVNNWTILGVPTAIWIGIVGIILAAAFLVVRHLKGWGTPGAWMHRADETDAGAGASSSASAEPQPG